VRLAQGFRDRAPCPTGPARARASKVGPRLRVAHATVALRRGRESALVHWLNDNETMPQYRPVVPTSCTSVARRPRRERETSAHAGLIGRFGADWFANSARRSARAARWFDHRCGLSTNRARGGAGTRCARYWPTPAPTPIPKPSSSAVTEGAWLSAEHQDVAYWQRGAAPLRSLGRRGHHRRRPEVACGIAETQRVVAWMANESSRQCGPCAFGLPALARTCAASFEVRVNPTPSSSD